MALKAGLLSAALCCILAAFGCDDPTPTGDCRIYDHVLEEQMRFHSGHDTVSLFFAADEAYEAPISSTQAADGDLLDSLIVEIYAYGQSYSPYPDPQTGFAWYSDSLFIWYSRRTFDPYRIDERFGLARRTPPCPPIEFYRIDYVHVRHAEGLVV
ncbi:MAG: hypothetical protein PHQ19_09695, partial [Candidatus Krumholzibacteria bacterium]|nr:hypothetical protein [Candidatus Krumholzibacteria bacterium]